MFALNLISALSLLGTVTASPTDPAPAAPAPEPHSCPFNATVGPNLMIANVTLPDKSFEINGWIYGLNWCSHANLLSRNNNDLCDLPPTGPNTKFEYMKMPLFDKFGKRVPECYANVDILFDKCAITMGGSVTDYGGIVANFTSKDGQSSYQYQCVQDVEYHGCVYNSQLDPFSEIKYEAFLSCGVLAEP